MILGEGAPDQVTGSPPPFLQEPSVAVSSGDERAWVLRVMEGLDRWRPALFLVVAPLVAATIGLAYLSQTDPTSTAADQTDAADAPSAFGALVDGVSTDPEPDSTTGTGDPDGGGTPSTSMPDQPGSRQAEGALGPGGPPGGGGTAPPTSTAPTSTTVPTTAAPPSSTTTTEQATTTTEQPTTSSSTTTSTTTTTEPPEPCTATVTRSVWLLDEPEWGWGGWDDRVGEAKAGDHRLLGTRTVDSWWGDTTWYQIDADGTVGWVDGRFVSSTQGDCDGSE